MRPSSPLAAPATVDEKLRGRHPVAGSFLFASDRTFFSSSA